MAIRCSMQQRVDDSRAELRLSAPNSRRKCGSPSHATAHLHRSAAWPASKQARSSRQRFQGKPVRRRWTGGQVGWDNHEDTEERTRKCAGAGCIQPDDSDGHGGSGRRCGHVVPRQAAGAKGSRFRSAARGGTDRDRCDRPDRREYGRTQNGFTIGTGRER